MMSTSGLIYLLYFLPTIRFSQFLKGRNYIIAASFPESQGKTDQKAWQISKCCLNHCLLDGFKFITQSTKTYAMIFIFPVICKKTKAQSEK